MQFTDVMLEQGKIDSTRTVDTEHLDSDMVDLCAGVLKKLRSGQKSVRVTYPGLPELTVYFGMPPQLAEPKYKRLMTSDRFFTLCYDGEIAFRVSYVAREPRDDKDDFTASFYILTLSVSARSKALPEHLQKSESFYNRVLQVMAARPAVTSVILGRLLPNDTDKEQALIVWGSEFSDNFAAAMFGEEQARRKRV